MPRKPQTLREALVERGIRSNFVADSLGLTEAAFSRIATARSSGDRLEPGQIQILADILRLDESEGPRAPPALSGPRIRVVLVRRARPEEREEARSELLQLLADLTAGPRTTRPESSRRPDTGRAPRSKRR